MTQTKKGKVGSSFASFLKAEGAYAATQTVAIKRVLAFQAKRWVAR